MNLSIINVNEKNYDEIINLKVFKSQLNHIETVLECIQEAKTNSNWRTVGIYDGKKAIGFAMYAEFEENKIKRVWLDRFLISADNQGKGYGKASVKLLISRLQREYDVNKIYLSVYEDNKVAIDLYKKIGFEFNGELDVNGEKVMMLLISN